MTRPAADSQGRTSRRGAPRGELGSATLELVVWAPGLLLIVGLLVVAGRVSGANGAVEQAAVDAARTASLARSPATAQELATATARQALAAQGLACTSLTVTVDLSGFATPPGQPATVSATVTCPVRLADLSLPGVPGTRTVRHTSVSALDTFRERALGFSNSEGLLSVNLSALVGQHIEGRSGMPTKLDALPTRS